MSAASIALDNVTRAYKSRRVVADVTLSAPAGKVLALLGPSGAGKSTILRLIAGLEPVDGGEIRLGGACVSAPGRTLAPEDRRVGFVFQDYALFPHLDARANVAFGLTGLTRAEREDAATRWLGRVGLGARARAYPHELSGGEQQRVSIARALANHPPVVLADEPTAPLDSERALGVVRMLHRMAAQYRSGIIVVTHDEKIIPTFRRLYHIRDGRTVEEAGEGRPV